MKKYKVSEFFKKIKNEKQSQQTLSQTNQRKQKAQINEISNERRDITTDNNEIPKTVRMYLK